MSTTLVHMNSPQHIRAEVVSSCQIADGLHLLQVHAPTIAAAASPGQFAMLQCAGGAFLRRPLSIHRVSKDKTNISFLFAALGKGTLWLAQTKAGDKVDVLGPMGNGFELLPSSREILLLAGGLGIAPLVFLAEKALEHGMHVSLAYGTATNQRCGTQLLPQGLHLIEFTDDGSYGKHGLVTECIPDFLDCADQIFACGPLPMYRSLSQQASLKEHNVQVSLETRMACGLGVCYGCTINTTSWHKQVCHHGPVFNMSDIVWSEMAAI
ncbi:MAG: dihydroorotate dehydrogenase electron transfer subunit [Dehalococcoidia bacterium]|nr:dihydroorotate dehydrogenase electron transfer subunit [Dehalococcoidia bacterium]